MKYILFLSILCFFIACNQSEVAHKPSNDDELYAKSKDIEKLTYLKKVEWPKAYAEQDTVLLDRILGDDFKMIDNGGTWYTKRDEIEWISKNSTSNDSFYYDIKRLDILENGTAIIAGTGHVFNDGNEAIYQSSNILVKREGLWKAVLSHVSGYKEIE